MPLDDWPTFSSGRQGGKTYTMAQRIKELIAGLEPGDRVSMYVNDPHTHDAWVYLEEVLTPEEMLRIDVIGENRGALLGAPHR